MRLQKRQGHIDEFARKEKHAAANINPGTWDGLLVRGLCFHGAERFVLKDINFALKYGEVFGVFGKNGRFLGL